MPVPIFFLILSLTTYGLTEGRVISFDPEESNRTLEAIKKDAINECNGKESINLSGLNLEKIQDWLVDSEIIRSISLENNIIKNIPQHAFSGMKNLECLNLGRNIIQYEVLRSFGHENLKTLIFRYQNFLDMHGNRIHFNEWTPYENNKITDLHNHELQNMNFPNLEHLDLSGSEEFKFNFSLIFPRLTHLYLNDRSMNRIGPDFFEHLPDTTKNLYFENNDIRQLDFPYVANVEAIFLDGNPLRMDAIFLRSTFIKTLSLSNCSLTYFNPDILMNLPNLNNLDLSMNLIKEISAKTFAEVSIKNLSLSENLLSNVPYLRGMTELISLFLDYNNIKVIEEEFPYKTLKTLSLRGNGIEIIVDTAFSSLSMLEKLDLAENRLTSIHFEWNNLMNLGYLNLAYNKFSSVENMSISPLSNLRDFFIKGNIIKQIDEDELVNIPQICVVYVA